MLLHTAQCCCMAIWETFGFRGSRACNRVQKSHRHHMWIDRQLSPIAQHLRATIQCLNWASRAWHCDWMELISANGWLNLERYLHDSVTGVSFSLGDECAKKALRMKAIDIYHFVCRLYYTATTATANKETRVEIVHYCSVLWRGCSLRDVWCSRCKSPLATDRRQHVDRRYDRRWVVSAPCGACLHNWSAVNGACKVACLAVDFVV